ncbi:MmgE/PrpD family protein [Variovorax guangxiensis]|uniref:MmgE/PrpD family protein n=1 Tax=Variovorax guangxiensis TaxID=1775474 RepID=UPI002858A62F|nr:MmgE/PrpD family protein [Variovorax guangxiensis]MDR6858767.1 2-methylcitrate dehydratase PrpD [Variovorax guangxiensis]
MTSIDISHEFASFAARCRYEDLPADAVDKAKKSILDLLGVSLAASGTVPAIRSIVELVRENGGQQECTVLGSGERAPALMAAFANGAMAHALDFDDMGADGHHPSSSIVPAVFAAAEHAGKVSGKVLITSVALGQDMFLRMRRNIAPRQDWLMTTVLGVFSATASVAHVLGLDAKQTANALGIASLGSCGTLEMRYGTESDLGQLYAGFMAKSAVLSALLARKGVTGTQSVFEGTAGIFNVYFGGKYDRDRMLADLGCKFAGGTLQYKPWPDCGLAHTYIHATLELIRKHRLASSDIREVRAYVGDFQQQMCYPLELRRRPATPMDARFSIPFALAAAVVYGELRILQFTEEGIRDPAVLEAATRIVPVNDSGLDWTGVMPTARIDIITRDGRTLTGTGEGTPGGADCPMGWNEISGKFAECAALAAIPPSDQAIQDAVELAKSLEQLEDATQLIRVLS